MQVTKKNLSDTKVKLAITADADFLQAQKQKVLQMLSRNVRIQGFRPGKAPFHMVEKHIDPARLQSEFLERAITGLYTAALDQEKLRPVERPEVTIKKFVPFDTLEIEAEVTVVGEVKLADYKKVKVAKDKVSVDDREVEEVITNLRTREGAKTEVTRASQDGAEVWIDFTGVDAKTKEPIKGADGKEYPLILGSNTFIPGFETNLVGQKAGQSKTFALTFPKNYALATLQNKKVEFAATVKKVQEITEPKLDDAFAAKVGPFKTVADLKADIKKELLARKQADADQKFADDLITTIAEKSKVAIPDVLIDEQIDRLEQEERQNLMYRGQTWQEYLQSQALTDETYRKKLRPTAELRVKTGLVLAEIAEVEQLEVTPVEVDKQIRLLKSRYTDKQMQAELTKPEARRSITFRLLTEKTVAKLKQYATA